MSLGDTCVRFNRFELEAAVAIVIMGAVSFGGLALLIWVVRLAGWGSR